MKKLFDKIRLKSAELNLKKIFPKAKWYLLFFLFIADIFLGAYVLNARAQEEFFVNFLDVGQGDAAFVNIPGSARILIDMGPSSDILSKLGRYMPFFDRAVDVIFLSHYDSDHMRGALSAINRYDVSYLIGPDKIDPTADFAELQKIIKEKNINFIPAKFGMRLIFGASAYLDVVIPQNADIEEPNFSVLAKLVYGGKSFLFTGDTELKEERQLLKEKFNLTSDVLKVAHHGSKYSTSTEFIEAVKPLFSVISSGKDNRYGHPHAELLGRLLGVAVLRTDLLGDIKIISDGISVYQNR